MSHPDLETLVAYWLRETDGDDALEEHLLTCDACGRRVDTFIGLGATLPGRAWLPGDVVDELVAAGQRVRWYRPSPGERVACTVKATDDLVASTLRLGSAVAADERVDALLEDNLGIFPRGRIEDLPLDVARGEVSLVQAGEIMRQLPAFVLQVALEAVGPGGTRPLGVYVFDHDPAREA